MEIRIICDIEKKQVVDFICNHIPIDRLHSYQVNVESLTNLLMTKHMLVLGAYTHELIGFVVVDDFQHIPFLYARDNLSVMENLLQSALVYVCGDATAKVPRDLQKWYDDQGFCLCQGNDQDDELITMVYNRHDEQVFTSYDQVLDFMSKQKDRVYSLDNFRHFMESIKNPQVLLKTIHIGGTNGKGSTTNFVRSVLQSNGYSVATFTSPALVSRLEIMRVNEQQIQDIEIVAYANRYMSLWLAYDLSIFEIEVFIAIMFFLKKHVDFAIFEVGLGGELDATNIVLPMITANTNIGLDHTEYLGGTYADITRAKAGIIKNHVPFFTGEKKKECIDIFQEICRHHQSPFFQVESVDTCDVKEGKLTFLHAGYNVTLQTPALYQCENAALAMDILLWLRKNDIIQFTDEAFIKGLYDAVWLGRFETVCLEPLIIIDGAHNLEGITAFCESAKKYAHVKIIFSALKDKDTHGMIQKLLTVTNDVTVCEFDFYRAQNAETLAEDFPVKIEKNWKQAVDDTFLHQGVVFVTGSLYFISQVRDYIVHR